MKWAFLIVLLAVEVCLSIALWNTWKSRPQVAYLIKMGPHYILTWPVRRHQYLRVQFDNLREAVQFAKSELALERRQSTLHDIEHAWVTQITGTPSVLWKNTRSPYLNRWSFDKAEEAQFVLQAFEQGGYAPSLFGHSLVFVPQKVSP